MAKGGNGSGNTAMSVKQPAQQGVPAGSSGARELFRSAENMKRVRDQAPQQIGDPDTARMLNGGVPLNRPTPSGSGAKGTAGGTGGGKPVDQNLARMLSPRNSAPTSSASKGGK